ncbi:phenoloxidase-activating enzyme-like isoform X2 [Pectinophora gossypiella]|uniref:phenoloxidase-activating enzyme-like isoform X2 n=1 Tax=Pectinophora gossypiella TaxID=13191 RepID=UPI00214EB10B|nr:phenoloxidase-activating enzyme-like isoform X2 [Pectinophora gossypiella]
MVQFMLISALVATYLCIVNGQSCRPPSGGEGRCISLYECDPLLAIVNKPNKSQQDINILRQSQCGFQGQTPKVCCVDAVTPPPQPTSNACFTADGKEGKCVSLYSCPNLANLLKPPVAPHIVTFVQNSRCQGPDQYSVCCGQNPPDFNNNNNNGNVNAVCASSIALPNHNSGCCGIQILADDRIVGGNATGIDKYPWLVVIEYVQGNRIKLLCGGALISGRYVLTAGHCVIGDVLKAGTPRHVRLGEYDTSNDVSEPDCVKVPGGGMDCTEGVKVIAIEKVIPHPQYNPSNSLRRNDIALLRLRETAPYTDFIRPICLPERDITISPPPTLKMYVAGWGAVNETVSKSDIKLHVEVPLIDKDQCQTVYSRPQFNVPLWNGQLCAGAQQGQDSCKGDSGGPLMFQNEKIFEVIGIVSFGPKACGLEGVPGVYTKVHEYNSWIRSQIIP